MVTEFCEHLNYYGRMYAETETMYQTCLSLMDQVLSGDSSKTMVDRVLRALNEWELQTRRLRREFLGLTKKGRVLLPSEGQNPSPVCGHCGLVVPRLEFPEFAFEENGALLFRGQVLMAAESVPA